MILCILIILNVASTDTNNPISNWEEWQPLAKIDNFLDYIVNKHDFVNIETLGESEEGKTMRVVKVNWNIKDFCSSFKDAYLF